MYSALVDFDLRERRPIRTAGSGAGSATTSRRRVGHVPCARRPCSEATDGLRGTAAPSPVTHDGCGAPGGTEIRCTETSVRMRAGRPLRPARETRRRGGTIIPSISRCSDVVVPRRAPPPTTSATSSRPPDQPSVSNRNVCVSQCVARRAGSGTCTTSPGRPRALQDGPVLALEPDAAVLTTPAMPGFARAWSRSAGAADPRGSRRRPACRPAA
jgi:hypothetical protein